MPNQTDPCSLPQCDTTDAYYSRLHRFPEVLEKRAAKLEVERLIHERSRLILDLEDLKGKARVWSGAKTEEERRRKIADAEVRLER